MVRCAGKIKALVSKKFFLRYHGHLPIGCSVHHPRGAVGSVTCFVRSPEERHHSLLTSGHVASSYGTTDADTLLKRPGSQGPDPLADFALVKHVVLPSCGAPAGQFAPGAADMDAAVARLLGNVRDDLNRFRTGETLLSPERAILTLTYLSGTSLMLPSSERARVRQPGTSPT